MRKRLWKVILIWFCTMAIACLFLYFLRGESLQLLLIDLQTGFSDNKGALLKVFLPTMFALTLLIAIPFFSEKGNVYCIKIHTKKGDRQIQVGYGRLFHQYINTSLIVCIAFTILLFNILGFKDSKINDENRLNTSTVIHAMGAIEGMAYTNSLEAFQTHYLNGEHFFEVDFSMTSDNYLVAGHDWGTGYQKGIDEEHVPNKNFFLQRPILGKYTPLTLEDILLLMQKHEDIYIITDTKNNDSELAMRDISSLVKTAEEMNATDVLKRFVIQIYSMEMYEKICDIYPFNKYIFTLYQIWSGDQTEFIKYCRFCQMNGIATITMWENKLLENPDLFIIAKRYDIDIFVHTVNDPKVAESVFDIGVKGIYTDDETIVQ